MCLAIKAALVSFAAQILLATPALSAEFGLDESRLGGFSIITVDGLIEEGDAERFRTIMQEAILTPGIDRLVISLDSPGGSVDEAIEIGRIVRATLATTWTASTVVWPRVLKGEVEGTRVKGHKLAFANLDEPLPALSRCLSACTIIFFSGVKRAVFSNRDSRANAPGKMTFHPTIGVHRPSYAPEQYGQLSPADAQMAYDEMLRYMSESLANFGAPDEFIERTMATPSSEIDFIPEDEMERLAAPIEPFFEDWLAAKCGRDTDALDAEELALYREYWDAFDDYMKELELAYANRMPLPDQDAYLVEKLGLAAVAQAYKINSKVRRWREWVDLCEEITVRTVRHEWATEAR